jgi:heme/copper-type cytochrome/quinol oxidase subunit 2
MVIVVEDQASYDKWVKEQKTFGAILSANAAPAEGDSTAAPAPAKVDSAATAAPAAKPADGKH